jgi:cell division protein FtsA
MPELAEQIFNLPVRRGNPLDIGGLTDVVNSPIYATGVGLVKYGSMNTKTQSFKIGEKNVFERVSTRMKEWFSEFF